MRYGITGVTGLVGGNLAAMLIAAGHEVVGIKRSSSRISHLSHLPIKWVDVKLTEPSTLIAAFDGCDGVFHCAASVSILMKIKPWIHEANIIGTQSVITAIRSLPAIRLVHCSSVVTVGVAGQHQPYDETAKWNVPELRLNDAYATTKRQSEEMVLQASDIDAVVVNPAYIIGPYDSKPSSGKLILNFLNGKVPGFPSGTNNFVDVRDVANGMILAMQKGRRGERYILAGHNMKYKDFFDKISAVAGTPPVQRKLPNLIARLLGVGGDIQGWFSGSEPFINSATVRWSQVNFTFSSGKAQQQLGYTISPIENAIRDAIEWFKKNQMLSEAKVLKRIETR